MPLARWASVSASRWSLATICWAIRSAVADWPFVAAPSSTYTGMVAKPASRAASVRRWPSRTSMPAFVRTAVTGCSTPCSRTLAMNFGSNATVSRTLSPITRVVGSRCSKVPDMMTFRVVGRGRPGFLPSGTGDPGRQARRSAMVRARTSSSDPAGERPGEEAPRALQGPKRQRRPWPCAQPCADHNRKARRHQANAQLGAENDVPVCPGAIKDCILGGLRAAAIFVHNDGARAAAIINIWKVVSSDHAEATSYGEFAMDPESTLRRWRGILSSASARLRNSRAVHSCSGL